MPVLTQDELAEGARRLQGERPLAGAGAPGGGGPTPAATSPTATARAFGPARRPFDLHLTEWCPVESYVLVSRLADALAVLLDQVTPVNGHGAATQPGSVPAALAGLVASQGAPAATVASRGGVGRTQPPVARAYALGRLAGGGWLTLAGVSTPAADPDLFRRAGSAMLRHWFEASQALAAVPDPLLSGAPGLQTRAAGEWPARRSAKQTQTFLRDAWWSGVMEGFALAAMQRPPVPCRWPTPTLLVLLKSEAERVVSQPTTVEAAVTLERRAAEQVTALMAIMAERWDGILPGRTPLLSIGSFERALRTADGFAAESEEDLALDDPEAFSRARLPWLHIYDEEHGLDGPVDWATLQIAVEGFARLALTHDAARHVALRQLAADARAVEVGPTAPVALRVAAVEALLPDRVRDAKSAAAQAVLVRQTLVLEDPNTRSTLMRLIAQGP